MQGRYYHHDKRQQELTNSFNRFIEETESMLYQAFPNKVVIGLKWAQANVWKFWGIEIFTNKGKLKEPRREKIL